LTIEPDLGEDFGSLGEWPLEHVVKCLVFCHPDDDAATWADHEATVKRLFTAARRNRLEFLLEVIPSKVAPVNDVLGLDAPADELKASFALAAKQPLVKGFAVGRTIFGDAARAWLKGEMTDEQAVKQMAERYASLAATWDSVREE